MKQLPLSVGIVLVWLTPFCLQAAEERKKIDVQLKRLEKVVSDLKNNDVQAARSAIESIHASAFWDELYAGLTKFADRVEALITQEGTVHQQKVEQTKAVIKVGKPDWQQQWIEYIARNSKIPEKNMIQVAYKLDDKPKSVDVRWDDAFETLVWKMGYGAHSNTKITVYIKGVSEITDLKQFSNAVMNNSPIIAVSKSI